MYEVHVFSATASATPDCIGPYRPGDRHPLLAFLRQASGTDHDWTEAERWVNEAGWRKVKFERAGTLNPENVTGKEDYLVRAFEKSMHQEFGFVVYDEVLPTDEEE
jgi:hypothetical protein